MCGIYGYIGRPEDVQTHKSKIVDLFCTMGIETESRGKHATGFYGTAGETIISNKAPVKASEFYLSDNIINSLTETLPNIMLGHNRWATHGDPKVNVNNHPFQSNRFGFIHNGVVGYAVNKETLNIRTESDCDSEWIFRFFLKQFNNHYTHFNAIKKTCETFKFGDFACAMIDSKEKKLFLWRNSGRPIALTFIKQLGIYVYSSTTEIIMEACRKCKIEISRENIKYLRDGRVLSIDSNLQIEKDVAQVYAKPEPTPKPKTIIKKKKIVDQISSQWQCGIKGCGKYFLGEEWLRKHLANTHEITDKAAQSNWMKFHKDGPTNKKLLETLKVPEPKSTSFPESWLKQSTVTRKSTPIDNLSVDQIKTRIKNRYREMGYCKNIELYELLAERINCDIAILRKRTSIESTNEFLLTTGVRVNGGDE